MAETWAQSPEVIAVDQAGSVVTLLEGSSFCISGRTGAIRPGSANGFYAHDARVVSQWDMLVDGSEVEPLTVSIDEPFAATFVSRAQPRGGVPDSTTIIMRKRTLAGSLVEEITLANYDSAVSVHRIEMVIDSDFAHIFAVKENRAKPVGNRSRVTSADSVSFNCAVDRVDYLVNFHFDQPFRLEDDTLVFEPSINPGQEWRLIITIEPTIRTKGVAASVDIRTATSSEDDSTTQRLVQWRNRVPKVHTDHAPLAVAVRQGQEDLGSLRIFDSDLSHLPVIAAGAPWFMTLFGRDSLLTAWEALIIDPTLSLGVLDALASLQGKEVNPYTEEQPGRILHELRSGSDDMLGFDKSSVYYGTVDATPLFVMLIGELRRWGLAPELTERLLPHVDAALGWIQDYGDADDDGYVEYQRKTDNGIRNQGWKDSFDSIRFHSGELADTPIALAEVQGYVFAAYQARKWFAREAGDHVTAERYRAKAHALKTAFNRDFWMEDRGYFAMALDGNKQHVDAMASNIGHCLWTGIVDHDKAAIVARDLTSPQMFSGWGVRTLSTASEGYNPIGYHTGSVWPHDTAICAAGLARYGFEDEARAVIMGLLDAAVPGRGRLPELFSGLDRSRLQVPVSYPTSCSPQAWAAASPLLALRTLLGFNPSIPQGHLSVQPLCGEDIRYLRVERIPLHGSQVTVEVNGGDVTVEGLDPSIQFLNSR